MSLWICSFGLPVASTRISREDILEVPDLARLDLDVRPGRARRRAAGES